MASRQGQRFIPRLCLMHSPSIHSYPGPFSLLAWHPSLLSLTLLHGINPSLPWPMHWTTTNTRFKSCSIFFLLLFSHLLTLISSSSNHLFSLFYPCTHQPNFTQYNGLILNFSSHYSNYSNSFHILHIIQNKFHLTSTKSIMLKLSRHLYSSLISSSQVYSRCTSLLFFLLSS